MKKLFLLAGTCMLALFVDAQTTNTFPAHGEVGIGTITPVYKFDLRKNESSNWVAGIWNTDIGSGLLVRTSAANNASAFGVYNGTSYLMLVKNDGNVGIGTNSPSAKLQVIGTEGHSTLSPQEDLLHIGGNELGGNSGYAGMRIGGIYNNMYYTYIRSVKTNNYGGYWNSALTFGVTRMNTETTQDEVMRITSGGNVGIGTTTPEEKLSVNGTIRSKEVKVEVTNWPDYVFEEGYKARLPDGQVETLESLERYIKTNKHLPGIPTAKAVEKEGISLGEMNARLLQKIEKMTLHMIEINKQMKEQAELVTRQGADLLAQQEKIRELEARLNRN